MTEDKAVEPQIEGREAREAQDVGEKPDLGQMGDALIEALDGSDSGSDFHSGRRAFTPSPARGRGLG